MARTKPFQEAVPWRHAVAPGVILNSDQALMRSYAIRGADLAGLSQASQGSMMQRLNLAFRRLPGQWSFHIERRRMLVRSLPQASTTDPVLRRMDAQRRQEILTKPSFESIYELTIRRRPPVKVAARVAEVFMTRPPLARQVEEASAGVAAFEDAADHFAHLLSSILSTCTPLVGDDLCTYLHTTCSNRWHRVAHPRSGAHLNDALCDARFVPGWEATLGHGVCIPGVPCRTHWHVAFCSVVNFPHDSRASLLPRLDHLDFENRQMTRWIAWPIATSRKLFRQTERAWVGKQQSAFAHFMGAHGYESEVRDNHARNQAEDADAANQEVAGAYVGYGHWTSTVMVYGATVEEAEARINLVREVFEDEDFTVIVEDEHTLSAFLSMLPGDVKHNVRKFPVSSINLAHMEPSLKAYWPGLSSDVDLGHGPWFLAHTEGSTLFRVVNRTQTHGAGHFAVIGPTGCHAKGTQVLMYDGTIKKVEDIRVGDVLMGPDSLPRYVLRLHRGIDELVHIIPTKGDPFTVNKDHMLSLRRTNDGTSYAQRIEDLSVKEWMHKSHTFRHTHKLHRTGVEFSAGSPLPIAPYVLGAVLGDGSLRGTVTITKPDLELKVSIEAFGPRDGFEVHDQVPNSSGCPVFSLVSMQKKDWQGKSTLRKKLEALGLFGCSAANKFIPHIYRVSSKSDRLEMLAGLLDTDGHYDHGGYDYLSKSLQLATDVVFVARSLGFAAYLSPCEKSCQGDFSGQYFRVGISGDLSIVPCRIPRKQAQPRHQKKSVLMTGFSVEPAGIGEYYGFECDGDHRYLTADFTVHHNSGKSGLFATMMASWLMAYWQIRARGVCLDIGRSMRALALCTGGQYDDLTDGTVQFQPLAGIEDLNIRRIRLAWLMDRLDDHHVARTTTTEGALRVGLDTLSKVPVSLRTFKELGVVLAAQANRAQGGIGAAMAGDERGYATKLAAKYAVMDQYQQIQAVIEGLESCGLFGVATHRFGQHRLHVTEIGTLLDDVPLANAVLPYFMHELRSTFTGDPVLFLEDEHALQVTLPKMEDEAKRDLRSLRKMNVSLGIATHDVADLFESQMGKLIINSCTSRFLLANHAAEETEIAETYARLGCTETEIAEIASMQPQGEYYLQQSAGNRPRRRKFAIQLQGLWLVACGSGTQEDHDVMDRLLVAGHVPGPDFAAAFVEHKAIEWKDAALLAEAKALREEAARC